MPKDNEVNEGVSFLGTEVFDIQLAIFAYLDVQTLSILRLVSKPYKESVDTFAVSARIKVLFNAAIFFNLTDFTKVKHSIILRKTLEDINALAEFRNEETILLALTTDNSNLISPKNLEQAMKYTVLPQKLIENLSVMLAFLKYAKNDHANFLAELSQAIAERSENNNGIINLPNYTTQATQSTPDPLRPAISSTNSLQEKNLKGFNCYGAHSNIQDPLGFEAANLSYSNFAFAHLHQCSLTQTIINKSNFFSTRFDGSIMNFANVLYSDFSDAHFYGGKIIRTAIKYSNLTDAKFNSTVLKLVDFTGSNCANANFYHCKMSHLKFTNAIVTNMVIMPPKEVSDKEIDFSGATFFEASDFANPKKLEEALLGLIARFAGLLIHKGQRKHIRENVALDIIHQVTNQSRPSNEKKQLIKQAIKSTLFHPSLYTKHKHLLKTSPHPKGAEALLKFKRHLK